MKELEKWALLADRGTLTRLLESVGSDDPLGQRSLSARLERVDSRLKELDATADHLASVALIFEGGPVLGSRSIDASFASVVLKDFQDMVSKRVASEENTVLAERGPLPLRTKASLGISALVRGSVGFVLEEGSQNATLMDTAVKRAMDSVVSLVVDAGAAELDRFEASLDSLDHRLLVSLRDFLREIDDAKARVKLVSSAGEATLDDVAIRRARERVESTDIREHENVVIEGELLGLLPDARRFELRLSDTNEVIRGSVETRGVERYLELIERPDEGPVGRVWRTRMKVREVAERNRPLKRFYTLVGLLEQIESR